MPVADHRSHQLVEDAGVHDRAEVGEQGRDHRDDEDRDQAVVERSVLELVEEPSTPDPERDRREQEHEGRAGHTRRLCPVEAQSGGEHVEDPKVRDVGMSIGGVHVRAEA